MKNMGRIIRSCICALGLLFNPVGLYAVETWVGGSTPDVINTNLILDGSGGNIILQGPDHCNGTAITAITVDIDVTLVNGSGGIVTVTGNAVGGQSILRLTAAAGRTITFDLTGTDSLTFEGSADVPTLSPLLILKEGLGNVVFNLRGGNSLVLTNNPGANGPVEFYHILQTTGLPSLQFVRVDPTTPDQSLEAFIIIGPGSLLSYASLDGLTNVSSGAMLFNPTNLGTGRFVLEVDDTGAFTMAVQQAMIGAGGDVCTVNRNIPAGGTPTTLIVNSGSSAADAGLMINNYNATYAEYLIDPYGNQGATSDGTNYSGSFNGLRYGVSAGANHILNIGDNAYLDYVGLANNICPTPDSLPCIVDPAAPLSCPCGPAMAQFLKLRNYSALTIDGWYNPDSLPSQIILGTQSGIYFRSGVDVAGDIDDNFLGDTFTIDPTLMTPGAGEYVFDVEARLIVSGQNVVSAITHLTTVLNSRIETLSWQVAPHLGPLFPVEPVDPANMQFLARTFATDAYPPALNQYNKAAWLINDRTDIEFTAIAHTDELHLVCQNNDVLSEPTYVGGEKWELSYLRFEAIEADAQSCVINNYCIDPVLGQCPLVPRPSIDFDNSILQVQTSLGATGLDFWVPTVVVGDGVVFANNSEFRFYSNGYLVDNGTGRSMILGTLIGSQACDGCTIISDDAHLNVIQDMDFGSVGDFATQILTLTAATNNALVNNNIVDPITGQTSVEVIYLGHNSNISIGVDASSTGFNQTTLLDLFIAGDFFNFSSRGGSLGLPSTSDITGQGGIFVDLNAQFSILPAFIASFDVMVTKSQNGIINLPPNQVFFSDQVGIADWQKDLTLNPIIVPSLQYYSDYTLNWLSVTTSSDDSTFMPYLISNVNVCHCPPFTTQNMTNIPSVNGQVDQLQVTGSRIGDPVHILINGGWVRELVFLSDCKAGEAPTAVVVLENNGRLGLNNAHRNPDSLLTQTVLGANGITLVADGNCRIDLNDDVIINNICAIIQGPNWAAGNVMEFLAETPYTIHVTKDGVLDLSSFTVAGTIRFGGNLTMSFEPGAQLILGASVLEFSDNAIVEIESAYQLQLDIATFDLTEGPEDNTVDPLLTAFFNTPNNHNQYSPLIGYGAGLQNTDPYRVRVLGTGTIRFTDNASMLINTNGIFSVENIYTLPSGISCANPTTAVTLEILEGAQVNIGQGNNILGGVFQIGNVLPQEEVTLNFTLTLNGADAQFNIGAGGFFGLGAGVVRPNQGINDNQTNVLADTLSNVNLITFNWFGGDFSHDRIFNSDDSRSASMVIGAATGIDINFDTQSDITDFRSADFLTSGGGNFFLLVPGSLDAGNIGAMRLIDRLDDNIINAPWPSISQPTRTVPLVRMRDGILASTLLISETTDVVLGPLLTFLLLKTGDATNAPGPSRGKADAAPLDPERFRQELTFGIIGYVDRSMIGRQLFQDVDPRGVGTSAARRVGVYELGAAAVQIQTTVPAPGPVTKVIQIIT